MTLDRASSMSGESCGAVIVTRPEPGASRTAAALRAAGWIAVVAPMLTIHRRTPRLPPAGVVQAVLVTSANGLSALDRSWHTKQLLAVGASTAETARQAGFRDVRSADGDALALARLAQQSLVPRDGPVLLVTAERQGGFLTELLRAQGYGVLRRAVYAARPVRSIPPEVVEALEAKRVHAMLFYSGDTARAFGAALAASMRPLLGNVRAVSISAAVDAALGELPFAERIVASRPTSQAVLAAL